MLVESSSGELAGVVGLDPDDAAAYEVRLARARVGGPAEQLQKPIELAEYDPGWPALYEREAARIQAALGENVVRLEHVGSTSVPGLPAKPIIDIVLEVSDYRRRAGVPFRSGGAGLHAAHSRARVVRAPAVQGPGHERQPPRVLGPL